MGTGSSRSVVRQRQLLLPLAIGPLLPIPASPMSLLVGQNVEGGSRNAELPADILGREVLALSEITERHREILARFIAGLILGRGGHGDSFADRQNNYKCSVAISRGPS